MSDAGYPDRWGRQCDSCCVVVHLRTAGGYPASPTVAALRVGWQTQGDRDLCPSCAATRAAVDHARRRHTANEEKTDA
jgi:hypothetical protein